MVSDGGSDVLEVAVGLDGDGSLGEIATAR